jgi:hypothetical protein
MERDGDGEGEGLQTPAPLETIRRRKMVWIEVGLMLISWGMDQSSLTGKVYPTTHEV